MNEHERTRHFLLELLAVIHRDGGHYADEHGIEKATTDAIAKHYDLRAANQELRYLINQGFDNGRTASGQDRYRRK